MAKSEKEKILKEEKDYLYTDSESGIGKKSKDKRVMDEKTGNMRRETIGPQQVWYTDEDGNSKFKRVRGDDQKNEWQHRLGKFADEAGARTYKSISDAIPDIEEDDSGFTKVMKGLGKMGANVVGGVAGSFVQATGNIPKFVSDVVDSAYYDDVQWGWNNVTESYNKHYEQNKQEGDGTKENIINSVTSAVSALEENNNDQSISAEGINQLINGPLGMAVGKLIKIGGNGLRRLTKSDDALKGVTNIADDGVKLINRTDEVLDSTKIFSKTDDLVKGGTKPFSLTNNAAKEGSLVDDLLKLGSKADDAAKTTSKSTNILERVANSKAWQVVNKVKNSKAGQVVSKLTEGTGQFLFGPFWDAGRVIGKSVNAAFKSTGVGKGVAKGITEIMAGTLDHAGNFLSKPLSYRTPKIWEAETSNVFLGGISEAFEQDIDSKEFREEHGYNIEDVDMLNEEKLEEYYNNNDIPEDKRLTAEQIAQEKEKLGDNFISDVTETRSKGLQLFDVFSTPARMQELQAGGDLEIEKNSRGETIGIYKTDGGLSVDFDKGIITDEDGNEVNDFTDEQFEELKDLFTEVLGEDIISQGEVEGEGSQGPIPTGDDEEEENNLLDSINLWATNGMITSEVAQSVVTGVNTKSHPTYIVDRMNEASKAYTNKIINMYTANAIKNDVKLQREIYNKLNLFNKIINGVPEVINDIDPEEYKSDVIEFRKALSASYEKNLTDKEKALFNENLYQASIDYNNDLEEGAERALMETATFMKRAGDNILSMIKSDDREFWYDQGLSSFGNELINPDTKGWTSGFRNVSNSLESNGSYLLNMWLLNKLNDRVVENYTSKGLDRIIKNNPKLNTKRGAYFKGSATEMASEPLENLLDHISLVDSSETGDEYWQGLLFGMFQGGLAGYASSTNSYTSFNEYMSRPENRTEVLQRMGIYIDQIKDPQQRAAALEITGKMFDNVAGIMKDVAGKTNNGVETIMQGYAIYQVENMIADYTTDLIGQAIDELNHVGEWTSEKIQYYFGTDQDTTGIKNFKNYNDGKNFNFSNVFMESIKNKQENVDKFNNIYNTAQAYIHSSFKTANMTLEEGINTMAPKVYESTGGKVITPIFGKKIVDTEIVNDITGNPISDIVTIFAGTNQIAPIIGDLTGISKDNPLVYGEKKNIFGKKTKGYKNKITVNQYDNNGKKIGEKTYTMRDYIVEEVLNGENALNKEQKRFIATILFRTSVSGYNSYFNADGSLTRLGEDFFEQVMPKLNDTGATTRFFKKMAQFQTFKEAEADKSERDAIKESGAGKKVYSGIVIEGHRFNNGDDVTNVSDEVRLPVEKDGVQVKMGDLKNGQTVAVYDEKSEKVYSMSVDNEGKLHINEETNEQTEVPFEEEDKPEKIGTIDWMRIKRLGYNHKTLGELEEELNYLEQEHKERQRQRAIAKKEKKTLDFNYEQIVGQINSKTQLLKSYIKFLKENPDYQPKKESTYKVMPGGITEVVVEENSQEDRNCTVPVSVSAEDHPSLEGKFVDAKELLAAWNEEKSYIPYMAQYEMTVPLDLPNGINNLHPEGGKEEIYYLPNDHFTKKENLERQPIVTIYRHDGTTKEYRLIWINDHEVKDYNGRMEGLDRADRFKSFILVDAKNGETAEKITTNTIRPFAYNPQGEKIDKAYYDNNIAYIIRDKNGNEINENRVIVMYHKTGKVVKWQMSTTIQVDRMNEKDINNAFKSNRVFMNEPSNSTSTQRHGWLGNEEVTYDARPIFTTSDIIFNKDNDMIDFGQGITVDISGRSYEKPFTYEGRKADQKTIQDIFNTLWKKGQKIQRDGSIAGEESNEPEVTTDEKLTMAVEEMQAPEEESQPVQTITKTPTEVAKGVTKIIKQQNDNVEMVIEEAKDTPAPATESIAETVVNEQNKNAPVLVFEGELQTPAGIKKTNTTKSELEYIKAEAIRNGTFMKAPNGKPSNLSEANWLQVRTKDFKEWFGDWENDPKNASKIVDENGEPLLVYHGGARGIETFRLPEEGKDSNTGIGTYKDRKTGEEIPIDSNRTIFFSDKYGVSVYYASLYGYNNAKNTDRLIRGLQGAVVGDNKGTVFPNLKNLSKELGITPKEGMIRACDFLAIFNPEFDKIKQRLLDSGKKLTKKEGQEIQDKIYEVIRTDRYKEIMNDDSMNIYGSINSLSEAIKFISKYNNQEGIKKLKAGEIPAIFDRGFKNKSVNSSFGYIQRFGVEQLDVDDPMSLNRLNNVSIVYGEQTKDGPDLNLYIRGGKFDGKYIKDLSESEIKELLNHLYKTTKAELDYHKGQAIPQYKESSQVYSAFLNIRDPFAHDYEGSGIGIGVGYKGDEKMPTGYINARQVNKAIKDGNDGVIYQNISDPYLANSYGVFDPNNIRFASQQITDNDILGEQSYESTSQNKSTITKIISGGQSGADKAGLQIAKALGIPTGGTAPKGYRTEKGTDNTLKDYGLVESESSNYMDRTKKNVDDSDGTIIIAKDVNSAGTKNTIDYANKQGKPVFIITPDTKPQEIRDWLSTNNIQVLNVAGNRGSKFNSGEIKAYGRILKDALEYNDDIKEQESTVLDYTNVLALPSPTELVADNSIPNEKVASRLLADDTRIKQLVSDCEKLGIVLESLDARELGIVIQAYRDGLGIDYVIEQFTDKLLTSQVDKKLVDLFIKKGILRSDVTYDGLSIQEMINYTAMINHVKIGNLKKMVDPTLINEKTGWMFMGDITDYYIRNYFHLNPKQVSSYFRNKIKKMVSDKLLESDIYIAQKGNDTLNVGDEMGAILELESLDDELKKDFATAAFEAKLISQSRYNYLMGINPYIANVNNGEYNPGIIASAVLKSINEIAEFGQITSETANKNKLTLLMDVYNYFSISRTGDYNGLIRYLKKKYKKGSKEMKSMISILEQDKDKSLNPIHSDEAMKVLKSPATTYEGSNYENFVKDKFDNTDAIIEALIALEKQDQNSFMSIMVSAPGKIKTQIYNKFYADNKLNHGSNIAYGLVGSILPNDKEVMKNLKREYAKVDTNNMSSDAIYLLRNFDRRSLINPIVTQQLYQEFGIRGLDLNKGTVILTNNGQDSKGKGMTNFNNVKSFPMLSVGSLADLKLDVNVIVPYGISVPENLKGRFNIIRMPQAGYHNGALVVRTYDGNNYNLEQRVYNLFGLSGMGISYEDFKLSKEAWNLIKESKNSNELYWNIFKYNILPNLGDEFQDISQEDFEKKLDPSKFEKVNTKTLFNAFAAKDINSMINASISIINKVTNYRLGIKSSSYKGRQGLDINTSINQFSLFVANTFSNSYDREAILKMYSEFIMAQLKKGDFDKGVRFHDFCENHAYALSLLNKVYKDRGQKGAGLSSIFINNGLSDEIPVDEEIDMSKIIANEGDLKAISEYNTKIKALRKVAAKKEQEWNSRKGIADTIEDIKERNKYREETGKIFREWQRILSDIDNLKEYRDDMIVAVETSDQESMQEQKIDIEQKENNTIVTQSFETKGSYEDNAIKVLSAIFNDYIDNNTMNIGDSTLSDLTGLKIVSKGLLGTISGANTFENKPQGDLELNGLNTEYSENRRNDISSKDLMSLQSMLMTLKETNPGKLKTILDSIIVTQENIGFEYYNNDEKNEKLKRVKEELFKYPVRFYSIMEELLSDPDLGVDVYYNVGFEKATGFKKVQVKGLLNSISQEYYDSKPVPMDSKTVVTLHEQFDKYFDIRDKDGKELKPSDEQIYAFWLLKNGFDNRTAGGVIPIAGIAGTGKTTLITALFNYINEAGGAAQDVTNISTGKQKVLVHNFEKKGVVFKKGSPDKRYPKDHKEMLWGIKKDKSDGYHYIKVENKESGAGVYIKFKKGGISTQSELDSKYELNPEGFIEEKSKALAGIYNNDAVKALYEVGGDNYKSDFSQFTFEISDFEVEDESKIPDDAEIMVVSGRQGYVRQRKGQNFNGLEGVQTFKNQKGEDVVSIGNNAEGLNNVSFAVRMHSTVGSLKDVFVNKGGLDGLDIATIDSYLVQDNPTLMNDIGYSTSYSIRPPKQSEGRIIIIDETQNSYNTHLKALVDGLSKNNVIVFLGDYHQMSKGDYLAKQENTFYMVDTHRGTEDINLINEISSFSQKALTKANAIGIYMSDSEDFVKYNPEDISSLVDGSIKKTLMVCSRNENRKKANDAYLQELGGTDEIIKKGGTIQAMIVDIESNKSSQRNRKSELPDEGLNMKGFIKSTYGNYYYRYNGDNIDLFFPSTVKTDKSDPEIEKALNTVRNWKNRKGYKYGQHDKEEVKAEIAIYVPAFAITTEKESGKTVDNIILHEDITNTEYDYLSEQNVKQYYDAFTRGSKKVYIPNNSTRLIGITKEQATKLREGQGLTSAVINVERDEVDTDSMNVPSINNGRWNNSYVVDKMYSFLDMFKKLKLDGTKEAKNELIKMQTIMTQYYLQGRMTTADAEVLTKFGNAYGFDIDNIPSGYVGIVRPGLLYQKQLQYHIAEIWDSLYSKIDKRKLHEYISKLDNAKEVFDNLQFINGKIYGQTIKTPHVTSNQNELLYGQKKYINKKIDLELMNQVQMQEDLIGEGSYLEGRLLKPVTRQGKDGKFYTMLQDVKVEWETTNKKGWLDYIIDGEKAAKEYEDMVRRINARLDINTYDGNEKLLFEAVYKELESTYQDMEDNDLVGVRDYIASSAAEDVFEDSALQIMYDSIENLAQNENANDIEELKNMLISLNGYIIGYKNGQTLGEIEKELHGEPVQFNESSAQNTINEEFTCNG